MVHVIQQLTPGRVTPAAQSDSSRGPSLTRPGKLVQYLVLAWQPTTFVAVWAARPIPWREWNPGGPRKFQESSTVSVDDSYL